MSLRLLDKHYNPLLVDPARAKQLETLIEMRDNLERISDGSINVSEGFYKDIEACEESLDSAIGRLCGALLYSARRTGR